ncbi:hypothetical protein KU6B_28940 [Mameliella alba]|nr:hypothetical protein KU6B_28940 [Mameliella alba]
MTEAGTPQTTFKRVMLKISGEALMGDQGFGLHPPTVQRIAKEVQAVQELGVEICMVIGAATSFAGWQAARRGWSAPRPITWACWPR